VYTPAVFKEADPDQLIALIERYSFGLLVSRHDAEPFATHLPFLTDRDADGKLRLIGHMARANRQWQQAQGQTVLAVFSGPHAYVSPTWYQASDVVPTWNYVAVHVYGTFRAVHDEQALMRIVRETVKVYERNMPRPWVLDTEARFNRNMVKGIVGFGVEVSRIEGKLKLSQNQPPQRRERVARELSGSANAEARAVAELMESERERRGRANKAP
jgi:transcriptional regulator